MTIHEPRITEHLSQHIKIVVVFNASDMSRKKLSAQAEKVPELNDHPLLPTTMNLRIITSGFESRPCT